VFALIAAFVMIATMTTACRASSSGDSGGKGGSADVTVALSSLTILMGLPLVAQDGGFFTKNGLHVKFVVANSAADAINIVLSGSADFVMSDAPAIFALDAKNQNMQFVANAYSGLAASVVLSAKAAKATGVSPTAPIADRLRALNGLSMSFASPTSGYLSVMNDALKPEGASVKPVFIEQDSMPTALQRGVIDSLIASPPVADQAVENGGVLWISGPRGDLPANVTPPLTTAACALQGYLTANPDTAKRFVAALRQASAAIESNPAATGASVAKRFPNLKPDLFNASWKANYRAFGKVGIDAKLLDQQRNSLSAAQLDPAVKSLDLTKLVATSAVAP
jgi:ABC-type nitrate/sulfonate/bicarbonate transport system substrate-binding protein